MGSKPTWLKVLMIVGTGAAAGITAATAGLLPAVGAGVAAAVAALGGLYHSTPGTPPANGPSK